MAEKDRNKPEIMDKIKEVFKHGTSHDLVQTIAEVHGKQKSDLNISIEDVENNLVSEKEQEEAMNELRKAREPKETIMGMEVEELEFAGEKNIQDHTNERSDHDDDIR